MDLIVRRTRTTSPSLATWFGGIGLGAGLMYLLDPQSGRRRRALAKDKAVHGARSGRDLARKATVDLQHRAEGLAAEVRSHLDPEEISDDVLVDRVRSMMGRIVAHPASVRVQAEGGRVVLSGPILEEEARLLLRRVHRMPQVRAVEDRLERFESPGRVPGLQGGQPRKYRSEWMQENWSPAARVLAGVAGAGLTSAGMRGSGLMGGLSTGVGATLLVRAVTNMPLKRLVGIGAGRRAIDLQKHIHIGAPVEEVFSFLRDLGNFPTFMEHVKGVRVQNGGRSHWVVSGPGGMPIAWDAETTAFRENEIIAWKSIPGSAVKSAGLIRLEPDAYGGTLVEVRMSYNPPAGALGHAIASLFGADPKHAMDDDLMRLKSLIELGHTRAHGQRVTRDDL